MLLFSKLLITFIMTSINTVHHHVSHASAPASISTQRVPKAETSRESFFPPPAIRRRQSTAAALCFMVRNKLALTRDQPAGWGTEMTIKIGQLLPCPARTSHNQRLCHPDAGQDINV